MQNRPLALSLLLAPVAALANPPDDVGAIAQCAQAAQRYLALTQDKPPANPGQRNARKLVQSPGFAQGCATQITAPQRACMIAAPSAKAWSDCLKPPKPDEVDPASDVLCTRPAGPRGPVVVTQAEYDGRRGAKAIRFSQLNPSEPLEVCGADASYTRLQALTCDDGSKPFASGMAVGSARVGNIGAGGRCKTMIDHYKVRCPEKLYDVHVDMYWCRPNMWPHY